MKQFIYADNAATTQLDSDAFEAMKPYLLSEYGNASQPYSFSRTAKKALKESREIIAHCIGAAPEEIFFTSGGTESDNWAIKGSAFSDADKRATLTSMIEHHAILKACESIERLGYPVAYLSVDSAGTVQPDLLSEWITDRTRLVSIMLANKLFACAIAWKSPVKCKFISSEGSTLDNPPPVAPPFMPKTGPMLGSLNASMAFLLSLFKASAKPIETVVLPIPVLFEVMAVTKINLPCFAP